MRSQLILRSSAQGTGTADRWNFTGPDERVLRELLTELDEFLTDPPEVRMTGWRRDFARRDWTAAMLIGPVEVRMDAFEYVNNVTAPQVELAWTAMGALRLAELLPDEYEDVREAILERFADVSAGD